MRLSKCNFETISWNVSSQSYLLSRMATRELVYLLQLEEARP